MFSVILKVSGCPARGDVTLWAVAVKTTQCKHTNILNHCPTYRSRRQSEGTPSWCITLDWHCLPFWQKGDVFSTKTLPHSRALWVHLRRKKYWKQSHNFKHTLMQSWPDSMAVTFWCLTMTVLEVWPWLVKHSITLKHITCFRRPLKVTPAVFLEGWGVGFIHQCYTVTASKTWTASIRLFQPRNSKRNSHSFKGGPFKNSPKSPSFLDSERTKGEEENRRWRKGGKRKCVCVPVWFSFGAWG